MEEVDGEGVTTSIVKTTKKGVQFEVDLDFAKPSTPKRFKPKPASQQQQRKEQVQMQQQMLQLMTRLGGALEGRMSPLLDMGAMQGRQTASFRPVGL